jgi:hypothetical protein
LHPRTNVSTEIDILKRYLNEVGLLSIDNKAGEEQWANII